MALIQVGDILLTRNAGGEDRNRSPGWYNHAAIYTAAGVVEAQAHVRDGQWTDDETAPGAVILSELNEFWDRYPIILVRRLPDDAAARRAAERAVLMVGSHYRMISSWLRFLRPDARGMNCVVVVRKAVAFARGSDPGWRRPDDISQSRLPTTVYEKRPAETD
jgi:hypothetical protein